MHGNSKRLTCANTRRALRQALLGAGAILVGGFGAAHAATPTWFEGMVPVSDSELAEMRGGFVLPNGMIVAVEITFYTAVGTSNGGGVPFIQETVSLGEDDLYDGSGVVHSVTVEPGGAGTDIPTVEISTMATNDMTGVMNVVQNNASMVAIQNMTTVNIDLMNSGISIQTFRANNFSLQMRSLGAFGL